MLYSVFTVWLSLSTTAFAALAINNKTATIAFKIQSQALKINYNKSYYHTTTYATYTKVVVTDTKKLYVISTQIHLTDVKNAYLNLFLDKKTVVLWGVLYARLESGSYTGKGQPTDSCNISVPSGFDLTNRRYVINKTVGSADIFLNFKSKTRLSNSYELRIKKGKIRFVYTITVQRK
ncbi:hypothetical protein DL98DRAFT_555090 [Cadophora sp. DSE1049]|nr:hypothetical protein DL98DRAFT_555090 [Cadophora sp. DSE1049]